MTSTQVSCSKLGRFLACPSSVQERNFIYNPTGPDAAMGTAGHAGAAQIVQDIKPNVQELAQIHNVDRDDLAIILAQARKAWEAVRGHFPNPQTEQPLEGARVKGRCDVISWGETGAILDWDFGWSGTDKVPQLKGYALAASESRGQPTLGGEVLGVHVLVRHGTLTNLSFSVNELREFDVQVAEKLKRVGKDYAPSPDICGFCPRQLECEARERYSRAAVGSLVEASSTTMQVTDKILSDLYPKWKAAKKSVEVFEKILGERLKAGDIQLSDRLLTLTDQEIETIDPIKAWPTIIRELTQEQLGEVLSVSKGALIDAVKAAAPRGDKGRKADQVMDELRGAGAVTKQIRKIRREVKP